MTRVQIPAYTDAWMKGDRYGVIVKIASEVQVGRRSDGKVISEREIAHVKLDKSGKTVRVVYADCTEV